MKKAAAASKRNSAAQPQKNIFFRIFENIKYELPILIVLLALFFPNRSHIAGGDVYVTMHIFDYSIGFAPRLFIGSLMSMFTDYKSVAFMDRFMDIFCIITLVSVTAAAGRVIRKSSGNAKYAAIFLVILFLAVPYSRSILYPGADSISLDRFMAVYALLALCAVSKTGIKWVIPALMFMGVATYHGFAFTYLPAIAVVLIYSVTGERRSKENIALCLVSFAVAAVFSAYFFLMFDGINSYKNIDELLAYAFTKTDLRQSQTEFDIRLVVTAFLLGGSSTFFHDYRAQEPYGWHWADFKGELISDLYLLPLIAVFAVIWIKAIKNSASKSEKFVFALCLLAPLARVPMFVFSSFFARSRASMVIVQFLLALYFLYAGNQAVLKAVDKGTAFLKRNYLIFPLAVLYFIFVLKVI